VSKESWAGERQILPDFGKPIKEYLCDLKSKLESAANFAKQHAKHTQSEYAAHYNL